jgi:hypothetical protein
MKKTLFLGLIISFGAFLVVGETLAWEGTNTVPVTKCVQLNNGVSITRFGSTYTLGNGVRNAGHGYRNYNLTCVSSTMYKVEWNKANAPAPVQDTEKPSVSVVLKNRNLKTSSFDATFEIAGSDRLSPVVQVYSFVFDVSGNTVSTNVLDWNNQNSTQKSVAKTLTLNNLKYNTTYYIYGYAVDSKGNLNVDVYTLNQAQTQDANDPIATLNVEHKNLKPNAFDLTMKVGGSDASSPVTRMEVHSYGYGYNGEVFAWDDQNASAKQVSKTFTLTNLVYNKFYNYYAKVFDKTGRSSITYLTNVSAASLMPTCNTTISGYGYYTLCLNQTATYNSNLKVTNIYAANSSLILKVNESSYVTFSLGEEKIVEGPYGVKVRVKFNSLDQQQNASIIISQA